MGWGLRRLERRWHARSVGRQVIRRARGARLVGRARGARQGGGDGGDLVGDPAQFRGEPGAGAGDREAEHAQGRQYSASMTRIRLSISSSSCWRTGGMFMKRI